MMCNNILHAVKNFFFSFESDFESPGNVLNLKNLIYFYTTVTFLHNVCFGLNASEWLRF